MNVLIFDGSGDGVSVFVCEYVVRRMRKLVNFKVMFM